MMKDILQQYANNFEESIKDLFESENSEYKIISDACKYSLLLGGKRIRPFLINSFYMLCGGTGCYSFNFEAAMECIHTYSLIHDDLPCMDNDDMRRGKPSCHIKFGEEYALLAGDALLTGAFGLASTTKNIDSALVLKALLELSNSAGINGMIGGQTVDLLYENKEADVEVLKLICSLKTGALIKASCKIGCILAGANDKQIIAAETFAQKLGLAFQIVDDILDETSTEEKLGKPIHSDKENNKSTFVSLLGIDECRRLVVVLTQEAKECLDIFGQEAETLKEFADYLCNRDY